MDIKQNEKGQSIVVEDTAAAIIMDETGEMVLILPAHGDNGAEFAPNHVVAMSALAGYFTENSELVREWFMNQRKGLDNPDDLEAFLTKNENWEKFQ